MESGSLVKDSFSLVDFFIRCFTSRFEQHTVGLSAARLASIWEHRKGHRGPRKVLPKLRAEVGSCVGTCRFRRSPVQEALPVRKQFRR